MNDNNAEFNTFADAIDKGKRFGLISRLMNLDNSSKNGRWNKYDVLPFVMNYTPVCSHNRGVDRSLILFQGSREPISGVLWNCSRLFV